MSKRKKRNRRIKNTIIASLLAILLLLLFFCIFKLTLTTNQSSEDAINITPTVSQKIVPTETDATQSAEITPLPITKITWEEAQQILDTCQIQLIFQKDNLEVTMTSLDNQVYQTTQPKTGDIIYEINHLPSTCTNTVQVITE